MKRFTSFAILVTFSLVMDRAFNEGEFTYRLAEVSEDTIDWVVRSGDRVADTMIGFSRD